MQLRILLAAMSMICGSASAQTGASMVDGDWIGKGSVQLGPLVLACSEIKIKFIGTSTLYGTRGASIVCENVKNSYADNDDYEVKPNNELYHNNRKVGNIVGNELAFVAPEAGEAESELTLRREGDLLYYYQVVRKPGQRPDYGVVAIMEKDLNADSSHPAATR
jgi:hypothetical protein